METQPVGEFRFDSNASSDRRLVDAFSSPFRSLELELEARAGWPIVSFLHPARAKTPGIASALLKEDPSANACHCLHLLGFGLPHSLPERETQRGRERRKACFWIRLLVPLPGAIQEGEESWHARP